jgi:RimJ/RimL family protein N-acetyltransferase
MTADAWAAASAAREPKKTGSTTGGPARLQSFLSWSNDCVREQVGGHATPGRNALDELPSAKSDPQVHAERVAENGALSLREGTPLSVRSLRPEDREVLRAGIERQSPDSQYMRFFTTFPHGVPRKVLDNLVDRVDGVNYIALVLLAPGDERIGVGRLVRDPHMPDSADISIAIDDAWQGRGAGTALGLALTRQARRQGIDHVTASVRIANDPALALLASLGVVRSRQVAEPGVYDLEVFIESAGDEGDVLAPANEAARARTAESPPESGDEGTSVDAKGWRRRTGWRPSGLRRGSRGEDCQALTAGK